jgi:hypothetical protein
MKSRIVIASLFLSVVLYSCKDTKKEEATITEKPETFDVTLNMVVKNDDKFQLYYTDESTLDFDDKKSFFVPVKGSENPQDIVFHFPEDVIPSNLRVDLGSNAKLSYYDKSFVLKDSLVLVNFVIGDQLQYDKKTGILTPSQGQAEVYDPLLYPQSNLKEEILKLIK